jgi:hypothetical protein
VGALQRRERVARNHVSSHLSDMSDRTTISGVKAFGIGLAATAALVCGCSASPTTGPSSTPTVNPAVLSSTLACPRQFGPGGSTPATNLVGHSLAHAYQVAEANHSSVLVVAHDGTCLTVIADLRLGRIDTWTVGNRVVKAIIEGPARGNLPTEVNVSAADPTADPGRRP